MALYSKPAAFSEGDCELIIAAITAVPFNDAMLVSQTKDQSVRRTKLVWVDDVDGLGWVMKVLMRLPDDITRTRCKLVLSEVKLNCAKFAEMN